MSGTDKPLSRNLARTAVALFSGAVALVVFGSLCAASLRFFSDDPKIPFKLLLAQIVVSGGLLLALLTLLVNEQKTQGQPRASLMPALLIVGLGVVLGALSDWPCAPRQAADCRAGAAAVEGGRLVAR